MDVKTAREAQKIPQRLLSKRTGISQATLSRIESGERKPTPDEKRLIDIALQTPVPHEPSVLEKLLPTRRAFICIHKECVPPRKVWLSPDIPSSHIPRCPQHGPMVRQANMPYEGRSTEPPQEWGWPEAREGVERRDEAMKR